MGSPVFGNEFFDQWLSQKSNEILAKVENGKITNEDMLILSLKAQVNHFHHMDIEFRDEFKKIDQRFFNLESKIDKRFDNFRTIVMWQTGIFTTILLSISAKLYL